MLACFRFLDAIDDITSPGLLRKLLRLGTKKLIRINRLTPLPRLLTGISSSAVKVALKRLSHRGVENCGLSCVANEGSISLSLSSVAFAILVTSASTWAAMASSSACLALMASLTAAFNGS